MRRIIYHLHQTGRLVRNLITRRDYRKAYFSDLWSTLTSPSYRKLKKQLRAEMTRLMIERWTNEVLYGTDSKSM